MPGILIIIIIILIYKKELFNHLQSKHVHYITKAHFNEYMHVLIQRINIILWAASVLLITSFPLYRYLVKDLKEGPAFGVGLLTQFIQGMLIYGIQQWATKKANNKLEEISGKSENVLSLETELKKSKKEQDKISQRKKYEKRKSVEVSINKKILEKKIKTPKIVYRCCMCAATGGENWTSMPNGLLYCSQHIQYATPWQSTDPKTCPSCGYVYDAVNNWHYLEDKCCCHCGKHLG